MSSPKITPFNIGLLPADLTQWFGLPEEHPYAGRVENLPIQCYLINLSGRCLLVDAPSYEFPGDDSTLLPEFKGRTIAKLLAAAGTPPETVTDVVITHPHLDHTLGLMYPGEPSMPVFSNARHYLSAKDWENLSNMEEVERRPLEVVQQDGLLTLVEGEHDLGDGLTLLPAPGETPGHQVLRLKDNEQETYFVADLFHHPLEFEEAGRHPIWADGLVMQASQSMLAQHAMESGAQVFFTHIEGAYCVEPGKPTAHWKKK